MVKTWFIEGDFFKERSKRIGASDIPALIPDPERPTQTLAGYGRTPVSVWMEKTGRAEREPAGLAAEMGHYLEWKAIELVIRGCFGQEAGSKWFRKRAYHELWGKATVRTELAQEPPFFYAVQYFRDGMICHPDAVYVPPKSPMSRVDIEGVRIDLSKPFLIEAKSASYWSAKRKDRQLDGYDFQDKGWMGVPMKHYMQVQFQLALLEVDQALISLIYDTNSWGVWEIRANRSHQAKIVDLAQEMVWHIDNDKPPKDLAINKQDVVDLYPELGKDFVIVNGEERETAIDLAQKYRHHTAQSKAHAEKAQDASDSLAVMLKDRPELRDDEQCIVKWQVRKGSERVASLSSIKANDVLAYRYLMRRGLITKGSDSRSVAVKYKEE